MAELPPDMWRTELWHPMAAHFPIVLLLGAAVLRMVSIFFSKQKRDFLINSSRLSLIIGVGTAWLAIYTGSLADPIVSRQLCDPTILKDHENMAYTLGYIFSAALLIDALDFINWDKLALTKNRFKEWIVIILLIVGSAYLGYTAHLGASLVYQQAAGVYQPTANCAEFE